MREKGETRKKKGRDKEKYKRQEIERVRWERKTKRQLKREREKYCLA